MRQWSGTVAFLNGRHWTLRRGVCVEADAPHVAASRAIAEARRQLPKRQRITAVNLTLTVRVETRPRED